jgi:DNA primase
MESNWVDFKAIKQAVSIEQILQQYDVKLKRSGKELRGRCPIHKGEGTDSFHANTDKNAFQCFSCQAKGNVLDFVAAMEQCSVRDAALKIQGWYSVSTAASTTTKPPASKQAAEVGERGEPNKPLNFRLQSIDHHHPYLAQRGVDPEAAEYFGVGFFSGRGSMSGRIVIAIENEAGELVAYAGRSIDESEPKYKLPAGFKKGRVLYNLPRATEETDGTVVLVEGFFDCIKVTQAEHACVALMGCSMSPEQEAQLVAHFRQVVIMLDGDEGGRRAATEIVGRLARRVWVLVIDLPDCKQPDQLSSQEVQQLLARL